MLAVWWIYAPKVLNQVLFRRSLFIGHLRFLYYCHIFLLLTSFVLIMLNTVETDAGKKSQVRFSGIQKYFILVYLFIIMKSDVFVCSATFYSRPRVSFPYLTAPKFLFHKAFQWKIT